MGTRCGDLDPGVITYLEHEEGLKVPQIDQGVICALRHIHMTPADALKYGLKDKSTVRVKVMGDRELIFGDVLIRVNPNFSLAMQIDTDEANAGDIKTGTRVFIDGIQNLD
jgi:acetate kinase